MGRRGDAHDDDGEPLGHQSARRELRVLQQSGCRPRGHRLYGDLRLQLRHALSRLAKAQSPPLLPRPGNARLVRRSRFAHGDSHACAHARRDRDRPGRRASHRCIRRLFNGVDHGLHASRPCVFGVAACAHVPSHGRGRFLDLRRLHRGWHPYDPRHYSAQRSLPRIQASLDAERGLPADGRTHGHQPRHFLSRLRLLHRLDSLHFSGLAGADAFGARHD